MVHSILKKLFLIIFIIATIMGFAAQTPVCAEKIGVLFVDSGEGGPDGKYGVRWRIGYFDHLFIFWPPGFQAGRRYWEGGDCYTSIHFANHIEVEICSSAYGVSITEGTPIDVLCNTYPELAGVDSPVISMFDEMCSTGDCSFKTECFDEDELGPDEDPVAVFPLLGNTTTNPATGLGIFGPHVEGSVVDAGIGIADFAESSAWSSMRTHYYIFGPRGYIDPYESHVEGWYWGDGGSLTNIKDALDAQIGSHPALPTGTELVYRRGSEALVENIDEYGEPLPVDENGIPLDPYYHDSVETALLELINIEQVDKVIVFSLSSGYTNLINYGPCWVDQDGNGISAIEGKTFKECIYDLSDSVGPDNQTELGLLVKYKPWDYYRVIMSETKHLFDEIAAGASQPVMLGNTKSYGESSNYEKAILEMLKYTVNKYSIPDTDALKVVLTTHGYAGGYGDVGECDVYFRDAQQTTQRVIDYINANFSWTGKFQAVHGDVEWTEPSEESGLADLPSPGKPFGDIIGAGEHIDMSIKGKYINQLGQVVDNGITVTESNDVFDWIVLIPNTFDAESSDTLGHMRDCVLGNFEAGSVQGQDMFVRQEDDQNGLHYGHPDVPDNPPYYPYYDDEGFTIRVMDASGWCSVPEYATGTEAPPAVCKGDNETATTVIESGTILHYPDSSTYPARQYITDAAVESIIAAIADPGIGGSLDEECEAWEPPTVISLSSFEASPDHKSVKIAWQTESELDNAGFNLYRSETENGAYVKINDSLIPAQGGPTQGACYEFADRGLNNGVTYFYKLEDVDISGTATLHGPVSATPRMLYVLF